MYKWTNHTLDCMPVPPDIISYNITERAKNCSQFKLIQKSAQKKQTLDQSYRLRTSTSFPKVESGFLKNKTVGHCVNENEHEGPRVNSVEPG